MTQLSSWLSNSLVSNIYFLSIAVWQKSGPSLSEIRGRIVPAPAFCFSEMYPGAKTPP